MRGKNPKETYIHSRAVVSTFTQSPPTLPQTHPGHLYLPNTADDTRNGVIVSTPRSICFHLPYLYPTTIFLVVSEYFPAPVRTVTQQKLQKNYGNLTHVALWHPRTGPGFFSNLTKFIYVVRMPLRTDCRIE